jgi:co-chaperonin GroES (HSP10)
MQVITPLGFQILGQPIIKQAETTEAGVIIPVSNLELPKATILAVSRELENLYKEGEVIMFRNASAQVRHKGHECVLISHNDVMAIITEEVE